MPTATAAIDTIWGIERGTYARSRESTIDSSVLVVAVLLVRLRGFGSLVGGLGRRGDVIDVSLDREVVFEVVHGVDAAAAALFDRASRLVFTRRAAFLAAQPFGRRWRSEVGAAIAPAGSAWGPESTAATAPEATRARAAEAAASGTWSAKPAASATEAARSWGIPRSWWAGRTILAGARFAHGQVAALEWLCVEFLDDRLRDGAFDELDERKPAGPAGLAIDRHDDVRGLGDGGEMSAEISLSRPVGEVPDKQTDCQNFLAKSASRRAAFVSGLDSNPELSTAGLTWVQTGL
jgi:hypothetical protein